MADSEISAFLLSELDAHGAGVIGRAVRKLGISRQAVLKRLNALVDQGDVEAQGRTRGRRYRLRRNVVLETRVDLRGLEEDVVYREQIRPVLGNIPDNIQRICQYGFTEILNNAIDHSLSDKAVIEISLTRSVIDMAIRDFGVGIFRKIRDALALADEKDCLVFLSKGKTTTDEARHSGQGIFFTSRLFDYFSLLSGHLLFWHRRTSDEWSSKDQPSNHRGTAVRMWISTYSLTRIKDVFDRYATPERDYSFSRTQVPVALAQHEDEGLVSRSQAKRLLARFDQFEEIVLDFKGVESIGQAFADEIFRVFRRLQPAIRIRWINDNEQVAAMIQRATDQLIRELQQG